MISKVLPDHQRNLAERVSHSGHHPDLRPTLLDPTVPVGADRVVVGRGNAAPKLALRACQGRGPWIQSGDRSAMGCCSTTAMPSDCHLHDATGRVRRSRWAEWGERGSRRTAGFSHPEAASICHRSSLPPLSSGRKPGGTTGSKLLGCRSTERRRHARSLAGCRVQSSLRTALAHDGDAPSGAQYQLRIMQSCRCERAAAAAAAAGVTRAASIDPPLSSRRCGRSSVA
nr:hypothetical protein CFP56_00965 [Quercus suber]